MAFEKINEFTDTLKKRWLDLEQKISDEPDLQKRSYLRTKQLSVFDCMIDFEQTTLQTKKFTAQKQYMNQVIKEINPAFHQGYYKPKTRLTFKP